MQITRKVEIEVVMERTNEEPNHEGHRLLHVKIAGKPGVPLPKGAPCPRRFVNDLIDAALATKKPKEE